MSTTKQLPANRGGGLVLSSPSPTPSWRKPIGHAYTLEEVQAIPSHTFLKDMAYNALDGTGTREVADVLLGRMRPDQERIYRFQLAIQRPAQIMTRRGMRINSVARQKLVSVLKRELLQAVRAINKDERLNAVWDKTEPNTVKTGGRCKGATRKDGQHTWPRDELPHSEHVCKVCGAPRRIRADFNPGSFPDKMHLFYDLFKVKVQLNKKGEVTTDDEALDRIGNQNPKLRPLVEKIQKAQDLKKQIGFLSARLTPDGRFNAMFNVGAAWTGRWSSNKSPMGEAGNAQNITERHRHIFLSDPGYKLLYADLKQAESNLVAHLAGDELYIEAHNSGDVHTFVTRLVWPDMPWTGDLKADKKIAKQLPTWDNVPGHDFRFQAKRIQHGSNYGLTPYGISMIAHIPLEAAFSAQDAYFRAFPMIPAWHDHMRKLVLDQETLVNPFGRPVNLIGKPDDKHTFKQGLAFLPQSAVADIINIAVWRLYTGLELPSDARDAQLLAQIHDAVLLQYLATKEDDLVPLALDLLRIPFPVTDIYGTTRICQIESEGAVGLNWGHFNDDPEKGPINLEGVKEV